jgi:hypothetical protein
MIMGNASGTPIPFPKCPTPFQNIGNFSCVMPCPSERGFERRAANSGQRCVYTADPSNFVTLESVAATVFTGTAIDDVSDEALRSQYTKERSRFAGELAIVYGKIDKSTKLRDAFQKLQDAENVRDQTPSAYQQARTTYYTLLKGDTWKEEERKRVLKAEVSPLVQSLVESKNGVMRQYDTQRRTIDVVKGLKDKVLSIKDDVKYAADTFRDQLDKVKNAIHRDRRERDVPPEPDFFSWFDMILNVAIVLGLLYVIYTLYRKFTKPKPILPVPRLGYA